MNKRSKKRNYISYPGPVWVFIIAVVLGISVYCLVANRGISYRPTTPAVAGPIIAANPSAILIEVNEGETAETEIAIINNDQKDVYLNFYKSDNPNLDVKLSEIFEKDLNSKVLLEYKASLVKKYGDNNKNIMKKSVVATGASWLAPSPLYKSIKAKQADTIKLVFNAVDLEPGDYKTFLLIVGQKSEESLTIPIKMKVKQSSKVRVSNIEIIDGTSGQVAGNNNEIVETGESVELKITLENSGNFDANNISFALSSEDNSVNFISSKVISGQSIVKKSSITISYILQVTSELENNVPPTMELTISGYREDVIENFYLGEEDKITYPTGLKIESEEE